MKDLSFLDIDQYVSAGVYQSQKVPVSLVKAYMLSENIEQILLADMQALALAGDLVSLKNYLIDDGSTLYLVMAAGGVGNQIYQYAIDVTSGLFGTFDLVSGVFTVAAPTLQQVLDAGNVSTQGIRIEDGAGNEVTIAPNYVQILNPLGGIAVINLPTLDESVTFELPDKPAGTETFAMLSDVSTPNIQQVLDEGNTSTTAIKIDNGTGNYVQVNSSNILMEDSSGNALSVYPDSMTIQNPSFGAGTIKATALANNVTFELPNKAAGTQTFAMLSDISGGGGDVYLANDQTFTGENTFAIPSGSKEPIIITKGGNGAGLKVTKSSGSGDAIEVAQGSVSISDESKRIKSLATSTYPSLTELARVKGVGSQVVGTTDTNTLTNKRITARTGTTTSSATPTINTDNVDFYSLTAQAVDITSFTTNLSGTPSDGQTLWIAITGTAARAITWGASFESSTITLPTTTVTTNRLDVAFIWNVVSGKWRCVGVA
jgi:hypothetical protein